MHIHWTVKNGARSIEPNISKGLGLCGTSVSRAALTLDGRKATCSTCVERWGRWQREGDEPSTAAAPPTPRPRTKLKG